MHAGTGTSSFGHGLIEHTHVRIAVQEQMEELEQEKSVPSSDDRQVQACAVFVRYSVTSASAFVKCRIGKEDMSTLWQSQHTP